MYRLIILLLLLWTSCQFKFWQAGVPKSYNVIGEVGAEDTSRDFWDFHPHRLSSEFSTFTNAAFNSFHIKGIGGRIRTGLVEYGDIDQTLTLLTPTVSSVVQFQGVFPSGAYFFDFILMQMDGPARNVSTELNPVSGQGLRSVDGIWGSSTYIEMTGQTNINLTVGDLNVLANPLNPAFGPLGKDISMKFCKYASGTLPNPEDRWEISATGASCTSVFPSVTTTGLSSSHWVRFEVLKDSYYPWKNLDGSDRATFNNMLFFQDIIGLQSSNPENAGGMKIRPQVFDGSGVLYHCPISTDGFNSSNYVVGSQDLYLLLVPEVNCGSSSGAPLFTATPHPFTSGSNVQRLGWINSDVIYGSDTEGVNVGTSSPPYTMDGPAIGNTGLGFGSAGTNTVYSINTLHGTTIVAGTDQGIAYSSNYGTNWNIGSLPSASAAYDVYYSSSNNTFYAGTTNGVLSGSNPASLSTYCPASCPNTGYHNTVVGAGYIAANTHLWVGYCSGWPCDANLLQYFNGSTWYSRTANLVDTPTKITDVFVDQATPTTGFVATDKGVQYSTDGGASFTAYSTFQSTSGWNDPAKNFVNRVVSNGVWVCVATNGGVGCARLSNLSNWYFWDNLHGLPAIISKDLAIDASNYLWVATSGGVARSGVLNTLP